MTVQVMRDEPKLSSAAIASARNSYQRLRLWGDGFDADQGELDRLLLGCKDSQHLTFTLLSSIGRILTEGLLSRTSVTSSKQEEILLESGYTTAFENARYTISHESDDGERCDSVNGELLSESSWHEIDDALTELRVYLDFLDDLNTSIEALAYDIDATSDSEGEAGRKVQQPWQFWIDSISERFPHADELLVDRLAEANLKRFQRIREGHTMDMQVALTNVHVGANSIALKSKFQDSGLGTSLVVPTVYEPSLISIGSTLAGEHQATLPRLTDSAKNGEPFTCDGCGQTLSVLRTHDWRKHVFHDLLPYTCIVPSCPQSKEPFPSRESWIDHLSSKHQWVPNSVCPLCGDVSGDSLQVMVKHLCTHMEEIALCTWPRDTGSDDGSEGDSDITSEVTVDSLTSTTDGLPIDFYGKIIQGRSLPKAQNNEPPTSKLYLLHRSTKDFLNERTSLFPPEKDAMERHGTSSSACQLIKKISAYHRLDVGVKERIWPKLEEEAETEDAETEGAETEGAETEGAETEGGEKEGAQKEQAKRNRGEVERAIALARRDGLYMAYYTG